VPQPPHTRNDATAPTFGARIRTAIARRFDSWANTLTGVGNALGKNNLTFSIGANDYLSLQDFENIYSFDGLAARVVDAVPKHALRHGFTVQTGDAQTDSRVNASVEALRLCESVTKAWTWGRLYGGGGLYLGCDDGNAPDEPLDEDNIRSFRWITDVDRRDLYPLTWERDPNSPRFGMPLLYVLTRMGGNASDTLHVHHSRVVRFEGVTPTRRRRLALQGWGESVLQRVYSELQAARSAFAASGVLLQEASQGVLKVKDLMDMMAADDSSDTMSRRLALMDQSRSVAKALLLDADGESFERVDVGSLTGVVDVMDRFVNMLAATSGIPVTVLMGQAPAGLNATGDSDIRNWYDELAAERQRVPKARIERVVRLLCAAKDGPTRGEVPEALKVGFPPLYQMTPGEQADLELKVAQRDQAYITTQVLTPEEVAVSRFRPEGWSAETSIDIDARKAVQEADRNAVGAVDESAPGAQHAAGVADVLAKVAAREISRDAGVALLCASFGLSDETAEQVMGENGRSYFTAPEPGYAQEMASLKDAHAALTRSHLSTKSMLNRVLERNRAGELVVGSPIAAAPTVASEGEALEEGDVVAVGAQSDENVTPPSDSGRV
jgi:phage-related protein (TIGR01555 family)